MFPKNGTRRAFLHSLFSLAACGVGSVLGPLYGGFGERRGKKLSLDCGAAPTNPPFTPSYLELHKSGELRKRGEELWKMMKGCRLCPRECGADRLAGEEGFCQASSQLEVSSYNPHFGEERSLVGRGGSGTIFFTNCSLRCVFCINWEISQEARESAAASRTWRR